jgi:hypothetical protein
MRLLVVVLMLPILAVAQGPKATSTPVSSIEDYLELYISTDDNKAASNSGFIQFANRMASKRASFRDDRAFLEHVFVKTHQKFLKDFEQYASFGELFDDGKYNCLTGTTVYALLLDHFNIDYSIIETNYHIFLTASTNSGQVLIEATDPSNGFITDQAKIHSRIKRYRQNELQTSAKNLYYYSFDLYNEVTLNELAGLLYYNHAVESYNAHKYLSAIDQLALALELYDSPRIEELSRVIQLAVVGSSLDNTSKEICVRKLQSIRKKRLQMMASAN